MHVTRDDDAVDRRSDRRVRQVYFSEPQRRLRLLHLRLRLLHLGLRLLHLGLGLLYLCLRLRNPRTRRGLLTQYSLIHLRCRLVVARFGRFVSGVCEVVISLRDHSALQQVVLLF